MVRSDLIDKEKIVDEEFITIQCAHGDTNVAYTGSSELQVEERPVTVEAAVSDTLPRSVLLGTDVLEMSELLEQKKTVKHRGNALVVVKAWKQQDRGFSLKDKESGAWPTPIMKLEKVQRTHETEDAGETELTLPGEHETGSISDKDPTRRQPKANGLKQHLNCQESR